MRNNRRGKRRMGPFLFMKRPNGNQVPGNGTESRGEDREFPKGLFYQAADFEKEDLWPMVSAKLGHIGKPGEDADAHEEKALPRRRPLFLFRPVFAVSLLLVMAGAVFLLSRSGRHVREDADASPAAASRPRAIIESARMNGRPAMVITFVQPTAPEMSFFWIGPQDN